MPLIQKKSKKAFDHNVEAEMHAGKPQPQALAIAFSVKRKPKKKATGGAVESGSSTMNYAKGGQVNESAKTESRPMPAETDKDRAMVSRNSGNKPPMNDQWTDNPTIKQAQKPSQTKLSRPKLVGSDAFSVRYKEEIDEDLHRMDSMPPETDTAPPPKRDDEIGAKRQGPEVADMQPQHNNKKPPYNKAIEDQYAADVAEADMKKAQSYARGGAVMQPKDHDTELMERHDEADLQSSEAPSEDEGDAEAHSLNEESPDRQGDEVPDMEREHSNGRKPYAKGGMAHEMNEQPEPETEEEHHDSIAAAIMAKKDREKAFHSDSDMDDMTMMADGGILSHDSIYSDDSDQADLSRNADEDANEEDQTSFNALRKEIYDESSSLEELDHPEDSNMKGDPREEDTENEHDMISAIRRKMALRRQF